MQLTSYRFLNDKETQDNLDRWWRSLKHNRGDRAQLRHAQMPEDVLLTEAFFNFLREMPEEWANQEQLLSSAIIAATLSHVYESADDGKSFVARLGSAKKAGDTKPRMSELRFQRLLKSKNPEEFFIRLLRAVRLSEDKANILSLSESILHWLNDYNKCPDIDPKQRLSVMWASDYYTALPKTKNKGE